MDLFDGLVRVDHFTRGAEVYFLTHYHSDHMGGLRKGWKNGTVFCTADTASLLAVGKGMPEDRLVRLAPGGPETVETSAGPLTVTALEANHCPGACMFLFEGAGERVLVTGDFRLDEAMEEALAHLGGVDTLLVDVTYDDPHYEFPSQEEVIGDIVAHIRKSRREIFVVETYTVGKNNILQGIHDAFGEPFYLDPRRLALYRAIGYGDIVTDDPSATRFFACGSRFMDDLALDSPKHWRARAEVIVATGWAVDGPSRRGTASFPYSEHCSWSELCTFVKTVNPGRIVVTEGGRATDRTLALP
jgi:Cft2 family RNA processing exonuclease